MATDTAPEINPRILIRGEGKNTVIVVGENEVLKVGQRGNRDIRTGGTILEEAHSYIRATAEKAKTGEALVDGEVGGFTAITDKLTQRNKDGGRALRKDMAGMIVHVNEVNGQNAAQNWQELNDPKKAKAVREKNWEMGLLHQYIKESGGDPAKLDWIAVSAYGQALVESYKRGQQIKKETLEKLVKTSTLPNNKAKQKMLTQLLTREGHSTAGIGGEWKGDQQREIAFDRLLGLRQSEVTVDLAGYLNRQFYEQAVKKRLGAERSQTVTRLSKDGKKMEVVQPFWEKVKGRARLSSRLSFESLDPNSELGKFLNNLGELDYWRGKAAIDRQWSLYTGVPIESGEIRSARAAGEGLFSVLNKDNVNAAEVNECCGPEAELQISKDDKVCDALNILYHLAEGKTYQESLEELKVFFKEKYNEDIDFNRLPVEITDAVRIAYFYAFDIRANGNKDARYKSWLVGEFENLAWVTDVNGTRVNLLGDAFALKPDDMVERGWWSGRNASLAHNAISGDPTEYNPKKYDYQNTAKWQYGFFYTQGLDRDNKRVRHYDVDPNVEGDNILPGTMGKFEHFDNSNRDHRRAVFDRLQKVAREDFLNKKPYCN